MAIAWTGLLSMFPLPLALHSLVGLMFSDPAIGAAVETTLLGSFPAQTTDDGRQVLASAQKSAAELGAVGLVGLMLAGSALFGVMADAFNQIYRAPSRGLVKQRVLGVAMVLVFSVLVVMSLLASAVANLAVATIGGALPVALPGGDMLTSAAAWAVSFLTAVILFLTIYLGVPNSGQRLAQVWPGALLSAALFLALGQVFPLYVRFFASYGQYAVFGLFFLMMVWFYFLAQVLKLGVTLDLSCGLPGCGSAPRRRRYSPRNQPRGSTWSSGSSWLGSLRCSPRGFLPLPGQRCALLGEGQPLSLAVPNRTTALWPVLP